MATITFEEITFEQAKPLWELLWPGRDDIRNMSSMTGLDPNELQDVDMSIYDLYSPVFFGAWLTDDEGERELVGVNSGHPTSRYRYRSRGLYVKPKVSGLGVGRQLLRLTIERAGEFGYECVWSMPRENAIKTYESAGFNVMGGGTEQWAYNASGVSVNSLNYYAEKWVNWKPIDRRELSKH